MLARDRQTRDDLEEKDPAGSIRASGCASRAVCDSRVLGVGQDLRQLRFSSTVRYSQLDRVALHKGRAYTSLLSAADAREHSVLLLGNL